MRVELPLQSKDEFEASLDKPIHPEGLEVRLRWGVPYFDGGNGRHATTVSLEDMEDLHSLEVATTMRDLLTYISQPKTEADLTYEFVSWMMDGCVWDVTLHGSVLAINTSR